jgi:hypothetical protein
MMYGLGIYVSFYNDLFFVRYQLSNFCVYAVGTKMSFKICVYAMANHTTCHNFRIYIKIGTTCMCLVVAIFFRSDIKIGPHLCI